MVSFGSVSHIFFCMRDAQRQLKSSRPYNDESLLIYIKKSYILITLFISNALQLCSVYNEIMIKLISYCFTIKKTVVMGLRIQPHQSFLSTIKAKSVILYLISGNNKWKNIRVAFPIVSCTFPQTRSMADSLVPNHYQI